MTRKECLEAAMACVCQSREAEYGSPEDSFATIASLWSIYLVRDITQSDVAMMMALLKVARIMGGRGKEDSYIDLAGYAACAGELETCGMDALVDKGCHYCEYCNDPEDGPYCDGCTRNGGTEHNYKEAIR